MKKNVSKFLIGIFFSSLMFFGCPQQPNESSSQADKFDAVENSVETKTAFEEALKGVTSTPKTEEDFQVMVKEIIEEFSSINGNNARFVSPNGDEISSKADIIKKLKSIIKNIENSVPSTPTGTEMKFSFDESINIKDATVTDLIEALSEIDELKNIVGNIDLPEDKKSLANDLVKINNLYAKAKADINFDMTKLMLPESSDESIGSANVEFLASAAVLNLEKLANETLPIKAVSAVVSMDANASATYKVVNEIKNMSSSFGTDFENTLSGASFGYNAEGKITLAVCTKSGKGGKLIIEGNVSIDKDVILGLLKIMNEFQEKNKDIIDSEKITEETKKMINDIDKLLGEKFKIKVSIGDFSKEYSYKELAVLGNNI
ncbi:MAG: hypothetical protein MR739_03220 [Spirochaetia bacterium]|nr:hypothetical protein [Spirochaetia bacterium]